MVVQAGDRFELRAVDRWKPPTMSICHSPWPSRVRNGGNQPRRRLRFSPRRGHGAPGPGTWNCGRAPSCSHPLGQLVADGGRPPARVGQPHFHDLGLHIGGIWWGQLARRDDRSARPAKPWFAITGHQSCTVWRATHSAGHVGHRCPRAPRARLCAAPPASHRASSTSDQPPLVPWTVTDHSQGGG